jgi:hypothetical protein
LVPSTFGAAPNRDDASAQHASGGVPHLRGPRALRAGAPLGLLRDVVL